MGTPGDGIGHKQRLAVFLQTIVGYFLLNRNGYDPIDESVCQISLDRWRFIRVDSDYPIGIE